MKFGKKLYKKIQKAKPLCVGIDPSKELLDGWDLDYTSSNVERFSKTIIDSCVGLVPAVKPQSAFFEALGSKGIKVLEEITHYAHNNDLLVILDVKRGDIGSTMDGYAAAHLSDHSFVYTDAITLSPFLGFDSLIPTIEFAQKNNKGVFVLVRTSNKEGYEIQNAKIGGKTVSEHLVEKISKVNEGIEPVGDVGAVIGTTSEIDFDISKLNGFVLAPGIGAQDGSVFENQKNVLYNASRSITKNPAQIVKNIKALNV